MNNQIPNYTGLAVMAAEQKKQVRETLAGVKPSVKKISIEENLKSNRLFDKSASKDANFSGSTNKATEEDVQKWLREKNVSTDAVEIQKEHQRESNKPLAKA